MNPQNRLPRITSDYIDGLPQVITYNVDNTIAQIVCSETFKDGSTATYTQTWTYPNATTCEISEWVAVFTPAP